MKKYPVVDGLQICRSCKKAFPIESYPVNKKMASGRGSRCNSCEKAYYNWYYSTKNGRAKKLAQSRRWAENNPIKYLLINSKGSAKKRGLEFDIKCEDVFIPEKCPLLGVDLFKGRGHKHPRSPSIDRIDSTKGYIKGNVRVISLLANMIKTNATPEQIKTLASNIDAYVTYSQEKSEPEQTIITITEV